ncbi:MAG TPA: hypothetical protein VGX78_07935 [Pirellulales bacterium]|nr:hypothetical protein [Pirellulales bacterium]
MRTFRITALALLLACALGGAARSADDAKAILEKGIKALGGESKLTKAKGFSWRSKGTMGNGDNEATFTAKTTVAGLDRLHFESEIDVIGNTVHYALVLDGDKGWRRFGTKTVPIEKEDLDIEKRLAVLQVVAATLVPLKGKGFQLETAGEEKVGDADAVGIKVKEPDGKDFKLYFDKTSGLPVKLVVKLALMDQEFTQETTYGSFRDFGGVKTATKFEAMRDGEKWLDAEVTDFKLLSQVDPTTFAEPKSK